MNSENVISLQAVSADLVPFRAVKVTSVAIDYAGPGDFAIGFILPGDLNRDYPSVQLCASFVEAVAGNGTDIVRGDLLEQAADGKYVKRTTGPVAGVAWTGATEAGDRFEAFLFGRVGATAPTLASTNGTAAGAADLAALKAETEKVGDDVRAIHAALLAAGLLVA